MVGIPQLPAPTLSCGYVINRDRYIQELQKLCKRCLSPENGNGMRYLLGLVKNRCEGVESAELMNEICPVTPTTIHTHTHTYISYFIYINKRY